MADRDDKDPKILKFPVNPLGGADEVARILETETIPTSLAHPLELYMPRDMLIDLVRASVATIHENRNLSTETPGQASYVAVALKQREQFLTDLLGSHSEEVYVAIYPVNLEEEAEIARQIEEAADPSDLFPFGKGPDLFS